MSPAQRHPTETHSTELDSRDLHAPRRSTPGPSVTASAPLARPDPRVVAALTGCNAHADRALTLRTRRAIYNALVDRRASREQGRRHLFIALLLTGGLTLALAPALWIGIDDMLAGETLLDLPGMLVALGIMLFAAVAAVLFLLGGDRRPLHAVRNTTRPPILP